MKNRIFLAPPQRHRQTPARVTPAALLLTVLGLCTAQAQAQSLADMVQAARSHDSTFLGAQRALEAGQARGDQARALLLPQVNLAVAASHTQADYTTPALKYPFDTQTATVSAAQPLYRPQNTASAAQGEKQTALAQAQYVAAAQDIVVRVSQAYFDVLAAQDTLEFLHRQKAAVAQQRDAARRNFELGNANVTEQRDAQASYDLVVAQEIAAENDLHIKHIALGLLTGLPQPQVHPLRSDATLPEDSADRGDIAAWLASASTRNPSVTQARIGREIAEWETRKAEAGHRPTLDLVGSYTLANNDGGTLTTTQSSRGSVAQIGVQFNLPLYAGNAIRNRVRETVALEEKARNDLEGAERAVALGVQSAYYGLASGRAQVQALETATSSSQSALDASSLGYQVGARTNTDVLNAQSQLFGTQARLARARYDVLTGWLRLRQAAGTLDDADLERVNSLLLP